MQFMLDKDLERHRFAIQWGGTLGMVAHPAYYFVWTILLPQPYDNLFLRLSTAVLCIPLVAQKYLPKQLQKHLVTYWYFFLTYTLPFVCTFLAIKNGFSTMWMMTEVMIIFVMALCIDSPLLLMSCVTAGAAMATISAIATSTSPFSLSSADKANIALFPIVLICSMLFSHSRRMSNLFVERNKTLQALAGSIAHEMRNPLSQIKASLQGIERALPVPETMQQTTTLSAQRLKNLYQYVAVGELAIKRGSQVIAMILDEVASKSIDTNHFSYLHAAQTTQKAIDEYGYETERERHKISIDVQRNFMFKGDETLAIFVLFNLIKNALYYFKLKPSATLTIAINQPTITLRDTGPGIPLERLPHLFESFQTSGKQGGTGLGLTYCKRVMQAFGGDITCRSALNKYTEFTLHFPEVTQSAWISYEKNIIERARQCFQNKRILVVDDDEALRTITQSTLSDLGAQIDQAENGQIALQQLRQAHYDLILMDLNMPVLDGYGATEKIRAGAIPGYEKIPIIAYTTESAYIAKVKTQKAGINGFVSKPCEALILTQTLEQALIQASATKKAPQQALIDKTILIADDGESNRDLLRRYLQDWGAIVLEAQHGAAVLKQLETNNHCNAVLLDMRMPGMDGLEVAQAIRATTSSYQAIPIIAVTAQVDDANTQATYLAGINDCISKPVDADILYEKLVFQINRTALMTDTKQEQENILFDIQRLEVCIARGLFKHDENSPYIRQTKEWIAILEASIQSQDFKKMQDALHFLKGSSANIGATALRELAARIEKQTIEGKWPSDKKWFENIKDIHTQTLSVLRTYF